MFHVDRCLLLCGSAVSRVKIPVLGQTRSPQKIPTQPTRRASRRSSRIAMVCLVVPSSQASTAAHLGSENGRRLEFDNTRVCLPRYGVLMSPCSPSLRQHLHPGTRWTHLFVNSLTELSVHRLGLLSKGLSNCRFSNVASDPRVWSLDGLDYHQLLVIRWCFDASIPSRLCRRLSRVPSLLLPLFKFPQRPQSSPWKPFGRGAAGRVIVHCGGGQLRLPEPSSWTADHQTRQDAYPYRVRAAKLDWHMSCSFTA
jgi:hypothetical protein